MWWCVSHIQSIGIGALCNTFLSRKLWIMLFRNFIRINCKKNILSIFLAINILSYSSKPADLYTPISPRVSWYIQGNGGELWKQKDEDGSPPSFITILRQDYFKWNNMQFSMVHLISMVWHEGSSFYEISILEEKWWKAPAPTDKIFKSGVGSQPHRLRFHICLCRRKTIKLQAFFGGHF